MPGDGRGEHDTSETRRHLEGYLEAYPGLRGRVCRVLLLHLHTKGHTRIEDVYRRAQRAEGWNTPEDPNRPTTRMWAADERELINSIVIDLASEHLSPREVDNIVWAAHRRDEAQSLEALARMPGVPLELIAEKVTAYASMPRGEDAPDTPEGTKVALLRRFISDRVDYIRIAKRFLKLRDLSWVLERVVSTESGRGFVGGKAAGMLLANAILRAGDCDVAMPETVFVLSDVYDLFKVTNGLKELEDHKYKHIEDVRQDFPAIREVFGNAEFPPRAVDLLRAELGARGAVPLVVRSSSLLEDNFGAAFSGIYRSIFIPNQGGLEQRLQDVLGAIAEIYAGVFSPDALSYRRRHDLLDYDERMAVMIQPVVGRAYGRYYLPSLAGVAFSRNDYRWSARIRREDGLARIVLGLGTRAVDRVGDYARMVALGVPTLRPEGTDEEIVRASQKKVDVVDLQDGGFRSAPVADVLEAMRGEGVAEYVSILEDGRLAAPVTKRVRAPADRLVVTFDRLLQGGEFTGAIRRILRALERAYGAPVDVEFARVDGRIHVVQCRPLFSRLAGERVRVPPDVAPEDRVFSARRYVSDGALRGVRFVVLVDPARYDAIGSADRRREVARTVGRLNDLLADRTFLLLGPGRWGSQDIRLGVQVSYADICNARALVEIARSAHGYTPEPSFGTHFFQDLIEDDILYLPLYPDEEGVVFNEDFLLESPNALPRIAPDCASIGDLVRVVDVEEAAPGRSLDLVMDGEAQEALCYLA